MELIYYTLLWTGVLSLKQLDSDTCLPLALKLDCMLSCMLRNGNEYSSAHVKRWLLWKQSTKIKYYYRTMEQLSIHLRDISKGYCQSDSSQTQNKFTHVYFMGRRREIQNDKFIQIEMNCLDLFNGMLLQLISSFEYNGWSSRLKWKNMIIL